MKVNNITILFFPLDVESVRDMFSSFLGTEYQEHYLDKKDSFWGYYVQQYKALQVRFILFSPKTNPCSTIMYANIYDGYVNLVKYVSRLSHIEYYTIRVFDGNTDIMQAYHFFYDSPSKRRHILCYRDPQWVFYEEGQPLWFENTNYYKNRLKKNRLNKNIIMEYLGCLGCDIENDDFWLSDKRAYEYWR